VMGLDYLYRGLRILNRPGIRRYFIIPLLINILVFGYLLFLVYQYAAGLVADYDPYVPD
ncbi:MAG: sulfate transporter CysZ, partial [Gammaproteobacteria bacterium]|nr:sulfate transporter CysZ [Gammaproteobacteria bacterium]